MKKDSIWNDFIGDFVTLKAKNPNFLNELTFKQQKHRTVLKIKSNLQDLKEKLAKQAALLSYEKKQLKKTEGQLAVLCCENKKLESQTEGLKMQIQKYNQQLQESGCIEQNQNRLKETRINELKQSIKSVKQKFKIDLNDRQATIYKLKVTQKQKQMIFLKLSSQIQERKGYQMKTETLKKHLLELKEKLFNLRVSYRQNFNLDNERRKEFKNIDKKQRQSQQRWLEESKSKFQNLIRQLKKLVIERNGNEKKLLENILSKFCVNQLLTIQKSMIEQKYQQNRRSGYILPFKQLFSSSPNVQQFKQKITNKLAVESIKPDLLVKYMKENIQFDINRLKSQFQHFEQNENDLFLLEERLKQEENQKNFLIQELQNKKKKTQLEIDLKVNITKATHKNV